MKKVVGAFSEYWDATKKLVLWPKFINLKMAAVDTSEAYM
jgi:hypothetical protein